ncbi:MAG: DUF5686 family protein, partial [Bacteroidales bacterium]|nr:DUF5686 family protein [Bacteroidales bacterium]
TYDKKFKYGMSIEYLLGKNPRKRVGFFYNHDMKQLGKYDNALRDDSFLSTLLQRSPNYKLTMVDEYKLEYEHEWFQGMSNQLDVKYQKMYSTDYVPLIKSVNTSESDDFNSLVSTEITLKTHFAHKEKFLLGKFDRTSVGTKSPVFDLWLTYGIPGVIGSEYEYFKVKASMMDNIEINPFGYTHMVLTAGKVFGKLPYPLLELHQGNETYAGYRHAFNMMNYYEFVSDEYVSVVAEHHFQGFFLKRIPLINFLELREVVGAKILLGRTTYHHQDIMDFPDGLQSLTKPYSEASVGVENILKFFRIDAVWRLSYLDNSNVDKFGLRLSMQLTF